MNKIYIVSRCALIVNEGAHRLLNNTYFYRTAVQGAIQNVNARNQYTVLRCRIRDSQYPRMLLIASYNRYIASEIVDVKMF